MIVERESGGNVKELGAKQHSGKSKGLIHPQSTPTPWQPLSQKWELLLEKKQLSPGNKNFARDFETFWKKLELCWKVNNFHEEIKSLREMLLLSGRN
jgi:hypothetical protein